MRKVQKEVIVKEVKSEQKVKKKRCGIGGKTVMLSF